MGMTVDDIFAEDAVEQVDAGSLGEVSELIKQLDEAKQRVAALEADVKEAKSVVHKLENVDIPSAMLELGVSSVTTDNGLEVKVQPFVDGSFIKGAEDKAIAWLEDNGFGDIIKASLSLALDRGDIDTAKAIAERVEDEFGVAPALKETVHPQTLKAFIRRCDEAGVDLPDDAFRVYRGSVAKLGTKK
jgi:archaellum component FlaC